jgi:hypothetical protein
MRKIALTAALIVATMSTAAMAADWVYVTKPVSSLHTFYVDKSSIKQVGPYKRAWSKVVLVNHPKHGEEYVALKDYDCAGGRYMFVQITLKLTNGTSETDPGDLIWRFALPGSADEHVFNYVCFGKLPY